MSIVPILFTLFMRRCSECGGQLLWGDGFICSDCKEEKMEDTS